MVSNVQSRYSFQIFRLILSILRGEWIHYECAHAEAIAGVCVTLGATLGIYKLQVRIGQRSLKSTLPRDKGTEYTGKAYYTPVDSQCCGESDGEDDDVFLENWEGTAATVASSAANGKYIY